MSGIGTITAAWWPSDCLVSTVREAQHFRQALFIMVACLTIPIHDVSIQQEHHEHQVPKDYQALC